MEALRETSPDISLLGSPTILCRRAPGRKDPQDAALREGAEFSDNPERDGGWSGGQVRRNARWLFTALAQRAFKNFSLLVRMSRQQVFARLCEWWPVDASGMLAGLALALFSEGTFIIVFRDSPVGSVCPC